MTDDLRPPGAPSAPQFEVLVSVSSPVSSPGSVGAPWWSVQHQGTYEQVTAALDELGRRIRADPRARVGATCRVRGEAYWPDGEPLHLWHCELPIRQMPSEIFAHAALIRQTAAAGVRDPKDWSFGT